MGQLASLAADFDSNEKPFTCRAVISRRRSVDLTDFDEEDAALMVAILPDATDPQLRARLADVACAIKFDHQLARKAAEAYLEAARGLADPQHWVGFVQYLKRATELAASLGKTQQPFKDAIADVRGYIAKFGTQDNGFCTANLIKILVEQRVADPSTHAPLCIAAAGRSELSEATNRWLVARTDWQLAAKLQRIAKDEEGCKKSLIRSAESHVGEAREWLSSVQPIHASAAHHLKCAVLALTQASAPKERIAEVYQQMISEQKLAVNELGTFST